MHFWLQNSFPFRLAKTLGADYAEEHEELLSLCNTDDDVKAVNEKFEEKKKAAVETFKQTLSDSVDDFVKLAGEDVVRTVETQKKEQQKKGIEDSVKDHLRGFSRTIPSFLTAYLRRSVRFLTVTVDIYCLA